MQIVDGLRHVIVEMRDQPPTKFKAALAVIVGRAGRLHHPVQRQESLYDQFARFGASSLVNPYLASQA